VAISDTVDVIQTALWPQGDIRDPLGVWGFRLGVTGDASGGSVKVTARAAAAEGAAYLYTCYSAIVAATFMATVANFNGKCRLLTNWPDIDPTPGVQGYSTAIEKVIVGSAAFTAPFAVPEDPFIGPADRFVLLMDPRQGAGALNLVELEVNVNVLNDIYDFEGYGYFWDRSVLNAPGGPRHPGAS